MVAWILIAVAVLVVLLGVVALVAFKAKGKRPEANYYSYFIQSKK